MRSTPPRTNAGRSDGDLIFRNPTGYLTGAILMCLGAGTLSQVSGGYPAVQVLVFVVFGIGVTAAGIVTCLSAYRTAIHVSSDGLLVTSLMSSSVLTCRWENIERIDLNKRHGRPVLNIRAAGDDTELPFVADPAGLACMLVRHVPDSAWRREPHQAGPYACFREPCRSAEDFTLLMVWVMAAGLISFLVLNELFWPLKILLAIGVLASPLVLAPHGVRRFFTGYIEVTRSGVTYYNGRETLHMEWRDLRAAIDFTYVDDGPIGVLVLISDSCCIALPSALPQREALLLLLPKAAPPDAIVLL